MTLRREQPPVLSDEMARTLPSNLESERAVLGAILVHNEAFEHTHGLVPADFYRHAHGLIFAAMARLIETGRAIDFVTLREELSRVGVMEDVGGPAYVTSLADGVPRSANTKHYVAIVREKAALRALIVAANKMLTDAYAGEETAADILHRADSIMLDLQNAHVSTRMSSLGASTKALFADFEHRVAHRGELTGVPTGFASIDELTFGWQPGDLVIIAARTSMGKTTMVMNTALAAAKTGKRVAFFSLEMRKRQLEYRMMSSLSGVACTRLLSGAMGDTDYPKISQAFEQMATLPILIDDRARQTVHDIRGACRRLKADAGLDLVVVDYVQLMPGTVDRKGSTRNDELTDISRRMKILADEISGPILMLSQLRRLEARRRPQLDDLRESGALEQDSDIVAFLHRTDHRVSGPTEFILAKQRNGPTGSVKLLLDRETLTFTDAGQDEDATEAEPQDAPRRRRRTPYATGPGQND